MSKSLKILMGTLILAGAGHAVAASDIDLAVKGLITPSACRPSLSAGTVDVGKVSVKDLNQETRTQLSPTTLQLNIDCEGLTLFAMKVTDNRADSATSIIEFGIGKTADNQKIGGYVMYLDEAVADVEPVTIIGRLNQYDSWFKQWPADGWQTDVIVSIQKNGTPRVPSPAKNTQMALLVQPFIHPAQNVTISEDTVIDGSTTLEVKYL